ncbi:MAG: hypothetical protein FGO69_10940 [Methanobacterium sp.]|nr:MAG: hypothetical protein FGO69_10940 [Methanobacterium sp.]
MSLDSEFEDTIKAGLDKIKVQYSKNLPHPEHHKMLAEAVLALSEAYKNSKTVEPATISV